MGSDIEFARLMARRHPTKHREIELAPSVADLLPRLVHTMDEPVADPAVIASYLICEAARRELKVMLSGMGADEIFAGYPRHTAAKLGGYYNRLPSVLKDRVIGPITRRLPAGRPGRWQEMSRNVKKFVRSADEDFETRYLGFGTYFDAEERWALYSDDLRDQTRSFDAYDKHREHLSVVYDEHPINRMLYVDLKTFLPCLNLTYTDKTSMAASVEVRVPFLDYEMVELAARIPADLKLRGLTRKYVLKRAMEGLLPKEVISRKKAGFGAPVASWLRGPLRPMIDEYLSERRIRERGLFRPQAVQAVVDAFREGREYNALQIWQFLTLELWMSAFLDGSEATVPTDVQLPATAEA